MGNWVGGEEENANYRGSYAQIFLSVGFIFCDHEKLVQSTLRLFLSFFHLQPLHYVCGKYDGLHLSTQNYT